MKPSFIVIGGVKCASSSLYRYLNFHPQILPCKTKEPGYFNTDNILKLLLRYRRYINLFPKLKDGQAIGNWLDLREDNRMHASTFTKKIEEGRKYITGEATANTFALANPKWVKMILPKVKLIMLLRDPTKRFISHYNMLQRFHSEGRKGYDLGDLNDFVDKEIELYNSGKETRFIEQGVYIAKLPTWKDSFKDNLKLFNTHDFSEPHTANETMRKICAYLEIDDFDFSPILKVKYNSSGKKIEKSLAYDKLEAFYAPYMAQLKEQYGLTIR